MKRITFLLFLFSLILNSFGQKIANLPAASSLQSGDLFYIVQSGTGKNLQYVYLGNVLNDTADILRAEFPPLWRVDIADTADVLRTEIAAASTADTAWGRGGTWTNYTFLQEITDSVGIGTNTPGHKLEVNGKLKALTGIFDDGYNNLVLGEAAGSSLLTTGTDNIMLGDQAGESVTTGDQGIFIGTQAGEDFVSGGSPVLIGYQAGLNLTGAPNIMIGWGTGSGITTGTYNTLLGTGAGLIMGGGSSYNTIIGQEAGIATGSINYSTILGYFSGKNLTESGATLLGAQAGEDATSSVGLTAVGRLAGANITTSDYHSIFGYQAGDALNASDGSSLFGYQAGSAATGAAQFSAFGYQAGDAVTTGDANSLFGYGAGSAISTASNNSYFGYSAGNASTGANNVAFGSQAGESLIAGTTNTLIGTGAGADENTSGVVALGYNAGKSNATDNTLHITNTDDSTPLIWGDLAGDSIIINGAFSVTGNIEKFNLDTYLEGSAATPTLSFGDGDAGLYEYSDDILMFSMAGVDTWLWTSTLLRGTSANAASLKNVNATGTNPTIIPNRADTDVGIGANGTDQLSLIAGGVEGIRITETGGITTVLATDTLRSSDYAGGPSAWAVESDRRVKENIENIENGLDIVKQLQGVRYKRKDKPGVKVGFIAQDVEKVLPEVVNPGDPYTMETAQITAVLTEAIKDQQKQIQVLSIMLVLLFGAIIIITVILLKK